MVEAIRRKLSLHFNAHVMTNPLLISSFHENRQMIQMNPISRSTESKSQIAAFSANAAVQCLTNF